MSKRALIYYHLFKKGMYETLKQKKAYRISIGFGSKKLKRIY